MHYLQKLKSISELARNKKKKHDKIVLVARAKLNTIEVLISKALIDSYISHHEFVSVTNAFREYNETKEEIKNSVEYTI